MFHILHLVISSVLLVKNLIMTLYYVISLGSYLDIFILKMLDRDVMGTLIVNHTLLPVWRPRQAAISGSQKRADARCAPSLQTWRLL